MKKSKLVQGPFFRGELELHNYKYGKFGFKIEKQIFKNKAKS